MNTIDKLADLIVQILLMIISILLEIKELVFPSQSRPTDFSPICNPRYHNSCFYITFPCRKYQSHRSNLVIEFWNQTGYIDHGDQFVFAEATYNNTPWSPLTIRFRPKLGNTTIINNYYDSNVSFQTNNIEYQIDQLDKLSEYINGISNLTTEEKDELNSALDNGRYGNSIKKVTLDKLWKFIIKNKDDIGVVADIVSVIVSVLGFFKS